MKRILVTVGCDHYDYLAALHGAERDASAMYNQLVVPRGDYEGLASAILLSPSVTEIMSALSKLPFGSGDIDNLTFIFAGHGGHKSGTYYLCARDTDPDRLSTTGLAVSRLLSVITELKPLQANVIIDACQSGSAMLDLASLLRAEALGLGNPGSLSIAFIAACGPYEYAAETSSGGELTQSVLSYIRGDATLQTTRPFLDLIELGRRVSAELSERVPDQVPVSWGINLTGEGRFAPNHRFAPATEELAIAAAALSTASLNDDTRTALQSHAFALWSRHRDVEVEADVVALRRTLGSLLSSLGEDKVAIAKVLRGLATSLRASAVKSSDVFAESLVLFVCAEPLLNLLDDAVAAEVAQQLLDEAVQAQGQARQWLLKALTHNRYCLLSDVNGIADLHFLPLRLSRILGWLAVGLVIAPSAGRSDAQAEREVQQIAELLIEHYAPSLVPRSDGQAAFVLVFVEAARQRGWTAIAETVIGCYFSGFDEAKGVIAPPDLADDDAFIFALSLGAGLDHVERRLRANPTQFLTVLLLYGIALGMDDDWDPELSRLDHQSGFVFVPKNYADFAATIIEEGTNLSFQIGLEVFTLTDFRRFMSRAADAVESAKRSLSPLAASLALIASCLQPDRLPLHVVDLGVIAGTAQSASN